MPTPAVPILTLCDQLVTEIDTAWSPGDPDGVERLYDVRIDLKNHSGRRVYVFPLGYWFEAETRGRNRWHHRVGIVTAERYTDAGVPLLTWVDDRVEFHYSKIVRGLDFVGAETDVATETTPTEGDVLRFGPREVWTEEIGETEVYDADDLINGSLFRVQTEFVFGEII